MKSLISEVVGIKVSSLPASIASVALTGARANVSVCRSLGFYLSFSALAITEDDCLVTLQQHDKAAGGNSTELKIKRYLHRAGGQTEFTLVESEDGLTSVDIKALFADNGGELLIDVQKSDMDGDTYSFASCNCAIAGSAVIASAQVIAQTDHEPSYKELF